jgi:hypothetical protein
MQRHVRVGLGGPIRRVRCHREILPANGAEPRLLRWSQAKTESTVSISAVAASKSRTASQAAELHKARRK